MICGKLRKLVLFLANFEPNGGTSSLKKIAFLLRKPVTTSCLAKAKSVY